MSNKGYNAGYKAGKKSARKGGYFVSYTAEDKVAYERGVNGKKLDLNVSKDSSAYKSYVAGCLKYDERKLRHERKNRGNDMSGIDYGTGDLPPAPIKRKPSN